FLTNDVFTVSTAEGRRYRLAGFSIRQREKCANRQGAHKRGNKEKLIPRFFNFCFIHYLISFSVLAFLGSSLLSGQFQPFTEVLRTSRREVTRKVGKPADPPTPRLRRDRLRGCGWGGRQQKEHSFISISV